MSCQQVVFRALDASMGGALTEIQQRLAAGIAEMNAKLGYPGAPVVPIPSGLVRAKAAVGSQLGHALGGLIGQAIRPIVQPFIPASLLQQEATAEAQAAVGLFTGNIAQDELTHCILDLLGGLYSGSLLQHAAIKKGFR